MRDYQDWTRADITARIDALWAENAEYRRCAQRLKEEAAAKIARGGWTAMEAMAIENSSITAQMGLSQRQGANAREVQGLQVELAIRDSPELVAQFGPGRD